MAGENLKLPYDLPVNKSSRVKVFRMYPEFIVFA
jgi:hypothetical protein